MSVPWYACAPIPYGAAAVVIMGRAASLVHDHRRQQLLSVSF
nr:MAG TPA: hypothetical protein [Caudoviricetes sp.]